MASDLSKYIGNKFIRWMNGEPMPSPPSMILIGLYDGDPKAAGVEVTTEITGYGRIACAFDFVAENDTDNELISSFETNFGISENDVANVDYCAAFDEAGNIIASRLLAGGPYVVTVGSPVKFNAGGIRFQVGT